MISWHDVVEHVTVQGVDNINDMSVPAPYSRCGVGHIALPEPRWDKDSIPWCSNTCPHYKPVRLSPEPNSTCLIYCTKQQFVLCEPVALTMLTITDQPISHKPYLKRHISECVAMLNEAVKCKEPDE